MPISESFSLRNGNLGTFFSQKSFEMSHIGFFSHPPSGRNTEMYKGRPGVPEGNPWF
jgi:hypothetical protein